MPTLTFQDAPTAVQATDPLTIQVALAGMSVHLLQFLKCRGIVLNVNTDQITKFWSVLVASLANIGIALSIVPNVDGQTGVYSISGLPITAAGWLILALKVSASYTMQKAYYHSVVKPTVE